MVPRPFFAVLLLSACASVEVETERDESAPFPAYRTFAFARGTNSALRDAFERELSAKGLRPDRKSPDLLFAPVVTEDEVAGISPYAYGPGPRRSPEEGLVRRPVQRTIITVTVTETESGRSVWRGRAVTAKTGAGEAIRALLAEFPSAR